ncbi:gustatory receptor 28b-like protein [Lasius niger]|uniref:Gustatory receptor 28b-like protein n=1 Tax=Lasius niger TaxID=67767 RepID=A0A0J7MXN2_LASNI|nr:gustatory receptor 28b-like protein [Lasius niger]KMQ85175.1 gustatory receptor 28b-like protein [Lasius niger]
MLASNYISIPFRINRKFDNKTKLTEGIEIVQSIFGTVVICTILLFYCVDQKSLVRIMNRLTDIEHEIDCLYSLYNPMRRQRASCNLIIVCILNTCLLIVLVTTEVLAFHTSPVSWLSDILPTFHVGWLIMQYYILVTIIQADFADVHRALQNLSRVSTPDLRPQTLCQTRRVIVTNSTVHQLLKLRDVHCHLCEISETVSDFYSLPILFGVTFLFLTLVYNGYYLLSPLLMSDEVLEYEVFTNTVFWLIYVIYPLALLTNRITKILNEVE